MSSPDVLRPGKYLYHDAIGSPAIEVELRDVGELGLGMFFAQRAEEDDEFVLASEVSGRFEPA